MSRISFAFALIDKRRRAFVEGRRDVLVFSEEIASTVPFCFEMFYHVRS